MVVRGMHRCFVGYVVVWTVICSHVRKRFDSQTDSNEGTVREVGGYV